MTGGDTIWEGEENNLEKGFGIIVEAMNAGI